MKEEKIQTLHPDSDKTNKLISLKKYDVIKANILSILKDCEPTHTELMEKCLLLQQIPGNVKFNHNWEIEDKDKAELKKVLMLPFIMMGLITIMWGYLLFYTL